ncbi:tail tubular protein A [Pelagibacter phage HTVC131P]|nr:tail tubular protein A [Pelagibacter phage HTVC131P]
MTTQITPTSELQAVNIMLSTIGESPVNSITGTTTVDVSTAKNILNETSMSIQSQGWNFNTHTNYKSLSLDSDNKVPLPSNCVKADANSQYRYLNYTIRSGYLYDMENHTDVFTTAPKSVDLVLVQQFEDLPEYARQYITMKAARRFAARFIGDREITQLIGQDDNEALMAVHQAVSQESDVNIIEGDSNSFSIIHRPNRRKY